MWRLYYSGVKITVSTVAVDSPRSSMIVASYSTRTKKNIYISKSGQSHYLHYLLLKLIRQCLNPLVMINLVTHLLSDLFATCDTTLQQLHELSLEAPCTIAREGSWQHFCGR